MIIFNKKLSEKGEGTWERERWKGGKVREGFGKEGRERRGKKKKEKDKPMLLGRRTREFSWRNNSVNLLKEPISPGIAVKSLSYLFILLLLFDGGKGKERG